ncbi:hypothetical protein FACS1894168_0430 [Deltaproteobacteria bacterium]|nr:hypothetical protein FACS1894168_0430 [Deltaproteobacteria bacterium]
MSMDITRLDQNERRSRAVIHNGTVYLAGQVADDPSLDITGQARQIFAKIDALLQQAGTDKSRVLTATLWIADMNELAAMNAVWDEWVVPGERPARCCCEATLTAPDFKLEIMVTAAL